MRLAAIALLALAACSAACSDASRHEADTTTVAAATPAPRPAATPWTVSPDGAGPVRVGMSETDARAALGLAPDTSARREPCRYLSSGTSSGAGAPGIVFMVERDTVVRVDVRDSTTTTPEGVHTGMTEAEVRARYPGVRTMPHKYTGPTGHYLVVTPGADTTRQFIFETDGQRVLLWRAGRTPQVAYVEGCA